MFGEENFCGFRAILSQMDPSCSGAVLVHPLQGGTASMANKTIKKICWLRLAVAVGRVNQKNNLASLKKGGEAEITNLSKYGDQLEVEDIRFIAKVLGRKIAIISTGSLDRAYRSMEVANGDGTFKDPEIFQDKNT